jgi:hypothetical protein
LSLFQPLLFPNFSNSFSIPFLVLLKEVLYGQGKSLPFFVNFLDFTPNSTRASGFILRDLKELYLSLMNGVGFIV